MTLLKNNFTHHSAKPQKIERVIIKVGSALLTQNGSTNLSNPHPVIDSIAEVTAKLRKQGIETVLVTSGAVAIGKIVCQNYKRKLIQDKQSRRVFASIGQNLLMHMYQKAFATQNMPIAQVLLTARDFRDRPAYLNMGYTLEYLSQMNVQAVINENDTIGSQELEFGDNDTMAAACASIFKAQLVIILTQSNGFLDKDQQRISVIQKITPAILAAAKGPDGPGSGGMLTKIKAAHLCHLIGSNLAILPGKNPSVILDFLSGENIGTFLTLSAASPEVSHSNTCKASAKNPPPIRQSILRERKKWLLFSPTRGSLLIDQGAKQALMHKGSSILIPGIQKTTGQFARQEIIEIKDTEGQTLGKGIAAYTAKEIQIFMGNQNSKTSAKTTPSVKRTVAIHRNNLVLLKNESMRDSK